MRFTKFTLSVAFLAVFCGSAFAYEADVDSAWIAEQNGGRTEMNDGNNEPNPDCIGDGCGIPSTNQEVQTTAPASEQANAEAAPADTSAEEYCTEADSANPDCADEAEEDNKKNVTYNEDGDASYVNENHEIYRARKEGFYTSINLGFRLAGGVNMLFGKKSDTWNPGFLTNFGIFVQIPCGLQYFRIFTALDFSYRRYFYEETTEFSDNEAYVEMYMFEIPVMFRYIGDGDGFFFGVGGDLGLKLSGFSEFKQEAEIEGEIQKDTRDKTIPTNGVEIGAVLDLGYHFYNNFGIDFRFVQYFTNLLDIDKVDESTLFKSELWPFNATLGVFYQF